MRECYIRVVRTDDTSGRVRADICPDDVVAVVRRANPEKTVITQSASVNESHTADSTETVASGRALTNIPLVANRKETANAEGISDDALIAAWREATNSWASAVATAANSLAASVLAVAPPSRSSGGAWIAAFRPVQTAAEEVATLMRGRTVSAEPLRLPMENCHGHRRLSAALTTLRVHLEEL